jgi:hypothetical protein
VHIDGLPCIIILRSHDPERKAFSFKLTHIFTKISLYITPSQTKVAGEAKFMSENYRGFSHGVACILVDISSVSYTSITS